MRERSSFHRIDGDRPRARPVRLAWLATNALSATLPAGEVPHRRWVPPQLPLPTEIPSAATPARVLCNLFWEALPAAPLRAALGGAIRVLDIGCGRGNYFRLLDAAVGVDDYLGIDIVQRPEWEAIAAGDSRARFVVRAAETLTASDLDRRTLVVSQSALEHVPRDLHALRQIRALRTRGVPQLQLHLVPPHDLWRMWGVHGYRGYTARNVRRIGEALGPDVILDVLVLGGPASSALHREAVYDSLASLRHRPVRDTRMSDPDDYGRRLVKALASDAAGHTPQRLRDASFLALAIRDRGMPDVFAGCA